MPMGMALTNQTPSLQAPRLTDRQKQVLRSIAARQSIKEIAGDLGVSESAINQHIRALKGAFGVNSLSGLAAAQSRLSADFETDTCRKTASRIQQVHLVPPIRETIATDEIGPVASFNDAMTYSRSAPWELPAYPVVVPGVLNGTNGKWTRALLIVSIAFGVFASVLVGLGAAQGVASSLASLRTVSQRND